MVYRKEKDPEKKKELKTELLEETVDYFFSRLEKQLSENGGYFSGKVKKTFRTKFKRSFRGYCLDLEISCKNRLTETKWCLLPRRGLCSAVDSCEQ